MCEHCLEVNRESCKGCKFEVITLKIDYNEIENNIPKFNNKGKRIA